MSGDSTDVSGGEVGSECVDSSEVECLQEELDSLRQEFVEFKQMYLDRIEFYDTKHASLIKRVAELEEVIDSTEDVGDATGEVEDVCSLERYSQMDPLEQSEELSQSVRRAVKIWENFSEWSSPTYNGRVLESGRIKQLLNAVMDHEYEWVQIYRAMKQFEKHTPSEYEYMNHDKHGRLLICRKQ